MTAAIKMLAHGIPIDVVGEYVRIGESTTIEFLKRFCVGIISIYGEEYLRLPTETDISRLLWEGKKRGFPRMQWLRMICEYGMLFFGMPGSYNDINVLDRSYLFAELIEGHAPHANYTINGNQCTMRYYLVDGIYRKWATIV
ncbi:uncharacterized protein LOC132295600 [Cornus florida]|uniref:uncharacterized protein LOC132295600 n=1 Tax=Cornus florida TaxID=4283 RepID=UPI0028A2234C|nr:uncharacterized protein LOC132295600 [Cornus florida]